MFNTSHHLNISVLCIEFSLLPVCLICRRQSASTFQQINLHSGQNKDIRSLSSSQHGGVISHSHSYQFPHWHINRLRVSGCVEMWEREIPPPPSRPVAMVVRFVWCAIKGGIVDLFVINPNVGQPAPHDAPLDAFKAARLSCSWLSVSVAPWGERSWKQTDKWFRQLCGIISSWTRAHPAGRHSRPAPEGKLSNRAEIACDSIRGGYLETLASSQSKPLYQPGHQPERSYAAPPTLFHFVLLLLSLSHIYFPARDFLFKVVWHTSWVFQHRFPVFGRGGGRDIKTEEGVRRSHEKRGKRSWKVSRLIER